MTLFSLSEFKTCYATFSVILLLKNFDVFKYLFKFVPSLELVISHYLPLGGGLF